jgi:hypothetical protein
MAESEGQRVSNDLEGGESTPLLANEADTGEQNSGNWKDYPANLWSQTTSYLETWRHARSERGKQRQVDDDNNNREGPDELRIPTLQPNATRLQNLKTYHPHLYRTLIALSSLILIVLFLLVLAIAHLFVITLRSPNEEIQQRIVSRSFSLDGPDSVEVLNVNENGLTVSVQGRIGIDGNSALDEWLGEKKTKGWYNRKERDVIEWAGGKIKGVQVDVGQIALRSPDWSIERKVDEVHLLPEGKDDAINDIVTFTKSKSKLPNLPPTDLVTFHIDPLYVPLPAIGAGMTSRDEYDGPEATTPLNLTILLKPSGPDLMAFAQGALKAKKAILDVNIESVHVRGLNQKEWNQQSISTFRRWSVPGYVDVSMGDAWKRLGQKSE